MAEGGYDPDDTSIFPGGEGETSETTGLMHHDGEEMGMKHRTPPDFSRPPRTSTSQSGQHEQETSFMGDTPSGEIYVSKKEQEMAELKKDVFEVFPIIDKKLLPFIRRDKYNQLILNLGKGNSVDWVIAFDGRPGKDVGLAKFPKGIMKALGKTNVQINQENLENQQRQEQELQKRVEEREKAKRDESANAEDLLDAKGRLENLNSVLREQIEAKRKASTPEEEEDIDRNIAITKKSIKTVGIEVDGYTKDRGRLEQATRDAEEQVNEGERQVETARERVKTRLLSLKDRIKEIFKKYGFTAFAVATAIGTVIGVIVSNLKAGLTKVAKGVGNGLKELGKKLGEILPGMIGAIASFIFRTAGEVIGFLAKNAWLLIVGLAVLAVEQLKKKSK